MNNRYKKICYLLIASFITIFSINLSAQEWNSYVKFGAGLGLSVKSDDYGLMFQGEYGKTYKWLDLGIAIAYETERPWKNYNYLSDIQIVTKPEYKLDSRIPSNFTKCNSSTSIALNSNIDIIKFFTLTSKHAVKVGPGLMCEFRQTMHSLKDNFNDGDSYFFSMSSGVHVLPLLQAGYEYKLSEKINLGLFLYSGSYSPCLGFSIRRNF